MSEWALEEDSAQMDRAQRSDRQQTQSCQSTDHGTDTDQVLTVDFLLLYPSQPYEVGLFIIPILLRDVTHHSQGFTAGRGLEAGFKPGSIRRMVSKSGTWCKEWGWGKGQSLS